MELRAGYKQTEVGVIPSDWNISNIGDITDKVGSGITPTGGNRVYRESGRIFVRSQNVGWGVVLLDDVAYIDESTHSTFPDTEIRCGDALLNITGASIGRCAVADERLSGGNVNQHVCVIRAVPRELNSRFLSFVLLSPIGQRQIDSFQAGGNRQGLNFAQVRSIRVPLPPSSGEQSAIATALGDVDALLAAQDALIAKKRAIKQGAMQELLTGKRRLPGFSGEWEVKRLGRLLESPVTDGPHLTPKFLDRGVPFLSVNNLVDGRIDWTDLRYISDIDHREFSRKCRPRKGDILFGKAASVGMVAFVETEIEFNIWSSIALIRVVPQFSARFVYRQLQSWFVERQILLLTNSSSQGNIGMSDIEKLEIAYPSSRDEQVAIAALLDDLDCEITTLETQRAKTAQLKQGMMQELLTGRIRLV